MKRAYALLVLPVAAVALAFLVGDASAGVLSDLGVDVLGVDVTMNRFQLSALMFSLALAGVYATSRARAK